MSKTASKGAVHHTLLLIPNAMEYIFFKKNAALGLNKLDKQLFFFFFSFLLHTAFKAICAMVLALTAFAEQVSMHDMFLHIE